MSQHTDWMEYDAWECTRCHNTERLASEESMFLGGMKCSKCGTFIDWEAMRLGARYCLLIWGERQL